MSEAEIKSTEQIAVTTPGLGITALAHASLPEQAEIKALLAELDLTDTSSIMHFGVKAQQQLTLVSDQMLEGVRNKDMGAAGGALSEMVGALRGFDVEALDPNAKPGFLARLFGAGQADRPVPAAVRGGPGPHRSDHH